MKKDNAFFENSVWKYLLALTSIRVYHERYSFCYNILHFARSGMDHD